MVVTDLFLVLVVTDLLLGLIFTNLLLSLVFIDLPSRVIIFRWLFVFYLWGSLCQLSAVCILFEGLSLPANYVIFLMAWLTFMGLDFDCWFLFHGLAYLHGLVFSGSLCLVFTDLSAWSSPICLDYSVWAAFFFLDGSLQVLPLCYSAWGLL